MELHTLNKEKGGVNCNRSRLVNSFKEIMVDEIMMLSMVASMLVLKTKMELCCVWTR